MGATVPHHAGLTVGRRGDDPGGVTTGQSHAPAAGGPDPRPPRQAVGELRAFAARQGVSLVPVERVGDTSLAAAAVAAEILLRLSGRRSVTEVPRAGGAYARVLAAAALTAATGQLGAGGRAEVREDPDEATYNAVSQLAGWVDEHAGVRAHDTLRRAGWLLSRGSGDPRIAVAGALVHAAADARQAPR